jgi:hypothetical protein
MKKFLLFVLAFLVINISNAQLKSFTENGIKKEKVKWGEFKIGKTTMSEISYEYYVNNPEVSPDKLSITWGFVNERLITGSRTPTMELISLTGYKFTGSIKDIEDIGKFLLDQLNNGDPKNPQVVEIANGNYWMSGTPKKMLGKKYLFIEIGLIMEGKRYGAMFFSANEKDLKELFNMQ